MRREDIWNPFLDKANRACELLQPHAQTDAGFDYYLFVMRTKTKIQSALGQHKMAQATMRLVDEVFLAMAGKRVLKEVEHAEWRECIVDEGQHLLDSHQLEAAKRCFLRVLAWPYPPSAFDRVNILGGMAYYHQERKDWVSTHCEVHQGSSYSPPRGQEGTSHAGRGSAVAGHARGCRRRPGRHHTSPLNRWGGIRRL